jgi:hypothetical protein
VTTDARGPAPLPAGASLHDFEPLLPAEHLVLRAAAASEIAKIGYRRPGAPTPDQTVRAELLAYLARGGGPGAPVAARQLQIMGAWVSGRLDLAGASVPLSLWLYRCGFALAPLFDGAHVLGSLSFADCALPGLRAEGCRIDGDLALSAGSDVEGEVRLTRTRIGREPNCERLGLRGSHCLFVADAMQIGGDVNLCGGVEAVGELRFIAAHIGGDLRASAARLTADIDRAGRRGVALNLDRACIAGSVALDAGFSAGGAVRLQQVEIHGDLDCSSADFDAVGDASWGAGGAGLVLTRAQVGGSLSLQRLATPLQSASLIDAHVGTLIDDASTWGQHLELDGFRYTRFGRGAPTDAAMRVDWLLRQRADHLGADFRPAPWRQVVGVLRHMGHDLSARAVALGHERQLRKIGAIGRGAPRGLRWLVRLGHGAFGLVAGYGQRPLRLLASALAVWLLCGAAYWGAAEGFAPSAALLVAAPRLAACRPDCPGLPATLPAFQPLVYSLDVLLPLVDLQQQRHWAPARGALAPAVEAALGTPPLRLLGWVEAACGWVLALVALVCLARWAARDRRG